jgi:hypothetical protein
MEFNFSIPMYSRENRLAFFQGRWQRMSVYIQMVYSSEDQDFQYIRQVPGFIPSMPHRNVMTSVGYEQFMIDVQAINDEVPAFTGSLIVV